MADKGFGVREIDLIGGDGGTPFIESPNNLNLNANTVGVSASLSNRLEQMSVESS